MAGGGGIKWLLKLRRGLDGVYLGRGNPLGRYGVHYPILGSGEWFWPPAQIVTTNLADSKLHENPWNSGLSPRT